MGTRLKFALLKKWFKVGGKNFSCSFSMPHNWNSVNPDESKRSVESLKEIIFAEVIVCIPLLNFVREETCIISESTSILMMDDFPTPEMPANQVILLFKCSLSSSMPVPSIAEV